MSSINCTALLYNFIWGTGQNCTKILLHEDKFARGDKIAGGHKIAGRQFCTKVQFCKI